MAVLHEALGAIIVNPLEDANYETVDLMCYRIWEWCTTNGRTPWGWCWDRYCACKVALSEHEPDTLPELQLLLP